jgi:hypothetical protein
LVSSRLASSMKMISWLSPAKAAAISRARAGAAPPSSKTGTTMD